MNTNNKLGIVNHISKKSPNNVLLKVTYYNNKSHNEQRNNYIIKSIKNFL